MKRPQKVSLKVGLIPRITTATESVLVGVGLCTLTFLQFYWG